MNAIAKPLTLESAPASSGDSPHSNGFWRSPSSVASFAAAALTTFTVSIVGEMPVGEFVLMGASVWAALCFALKHAWPGDLLRSRLLGSLLAAQAVALAAYIFSDLYRHSFPVDMARGWSRMVFLAIDIVAVAYLFGCSRRNLVLFVLGQCAGEAAGAWLIGPMFGDWWKFGFATPATYLAFLVAPLAGPWAAIAAAGAMGVLNFELDYRSLGGLCLAAAMLNLLQTAPRRLRIWLAAPAAAVAAAAVLAVYHQTQVNGERAERSDIERSSMMTAAFEAFQSSPWIGYGSWFSNTRVYDDFMEIRHTKARESRVGGFADANRDPGAVALHSQILVTLAEGGVFGGAFFVVFGASLIGALSTLVFSRRWHRLAPISLLLLLDALWNLFCSPFSGAHRVYIAAACGLVLMIRRPPERDPVESPASAPS